MDWGECAARERYDLRAAMFGGPVACVERRKACRGFALMRAGVLPDYFALAARYFSRTC